MHLLCDVLPCPIQSSHAGRQQNISHNIDESRSKVSKEMAQVSGNSNTFPDEPIRERVLSPLPASSETVVREERGHHKRCERNSNKKAKTRDSERTTVVATRQQRKSRLSIETCKQYCKFKFEHPIYIYICWLTVNVPRSTSRSTSHLRVPKHITPQAEQRHERRRKESSSERCLHHSTPPPPSPIHSALGQVGTFLPSPPVKWLPSSCQCSLDWYKFPELSAYFFLSFILCFLSMPAVHLCVMNSKKMCCNPESYIFVEKLWKFRRWAASEIVSY